MRVAMYYNNRDVRIEERPVPHIGPGELLVKVMSSGICGSDVMEWYRIKKAPLVLGHEIAGEIVEVGDDVETYKSGDRVFVSHHIPCNTCRYCLRGDHTTCETLHTTNYDPGGFSEYIRVPQLNVDRGVFLLPPGISYDEGAFIEPLACAVRGQRVAGLQPGQSVLVLGSGMAGLMHALLARALGAVRIVVTDISEYRLQMAKELGVDVVLHAGENIPARLMEINDGHLADVAIVCTGALSAFSQALESVERGGTVLCYTTTEPGVDIAIPLYDFWRNQVKMIATYGNAPRDAVVAIELIRAGRIAVTPMITHRLPLEETALGFHLVAEGRESMKVIIKPHGPEVQQ